MRQLFIVLVLMGTGFAAERRLTSSPVGARLVYSTFLGGGGDKFWEWGSSIAVDAAGNAYIAGTTQSPSFPLVNAAQTNFGGGRFGADAFVAKLSAAGTNLVYATYLGGNGNEGDSGPAIAVDNAGNAYVAGGTTSKNFPVRNAWQPSLRGKRNAFLVKLDPTGALVYATYLGGSGSDAAKAVAVDAAGNVYVAGQTTSTNFPGAPPGNHGGTDVFVAKLDATGAPVYATRFGGRRDEFATGLAVDTNGHVVVVGETASPDFPTMAGTVQPTFGGGALNGDAFVAKLDATGGPVYVTYLGGTRNDGAAAVAVTPEGSALVTGYTESGNFPTANALQPVKRGFSDAFVAKLDPAGTRLVYATFLGGSRSENLDHFGGIAVDGAGRAFVTGGTDSWDFPLAAPFQTRCGDCGGLAYGAFVAQLDADGAALLYATYLTGACVDTAQAIAVDAAGNAYVTGGTCSKRFPRALPLQPVLRGDSDVFITKIAPEPAVDLAVLAIRAPNRVTLHTQPLTRPVTVTIQNRSPRAETITDAAMLGNLVTLRVEPLRAGCPALVPVLRAGRLPVTLAPKQTLTVVFQVTFDPACVPDPVLSTKSNPGHEDYRYVATVRHEAIDGVPDTHPECDVCPRAPLGYDANPNGTILDTGCATVLTDVLLR